MLWSIARLIWAVAMLLVYIYDIELLQDSDTPRWSFLLLFLLFVVCEIIPIIGMLDYSYMNIIGFEHNATNEMNALASGQRSEARPQVQGTSTDSQNISLHSKRERSKSAGKYVRFRMDDPTFDSMSSDPTQPLLKDLS